MGCFQNELSISMNCVNGQCSICGERDERARKKCFNSEQDCELREFRVRESRALEFRESECRDCKLRNRDFWDRCRESRVRGFCDRECHHALTAIMHCMFSHRAGTIHLEQFSFL